MVDDVHVIDRAGDLNHSDGFQSACKPGNESAASQVAHARRAPNWRPTYVTRVAPSRIGTIDKPVDIETITNVT